MPTSYTKETRPTTTYTKETKPQGDQVDVHIGNPFGAWLWLTYPVRIVSGQTLYTKETRPTTNYTKETKP